MAAKKKEKPWSDADANAMVGKVCMVTGANTGIGKVTALELAKVWAKVVMVCRNPQKGEAAKKEIEEASGSNNVDLMIADLSSLKAVRQLASDFRKKYDRLHVLVNNAGAIIKKRIVAEEGFEAQFALHVLTPFLLTNLLLDELKASAPARVINVSSKMHFFAKMDFDDLQGEKKYSGFGIYGRTKLANILLSYEMARQYKGTGITVNTLHPGSVATELGRDVKNPLTSVLSLFTVNPEKGAETQLYLACSQKVDGVTGKYFEKCKPCESSKATYSTSHALKIWGICSKLTGFNPSQQAMNTVYIDE